MKRSLISLAIAAVATATTLAGAHPAPSGAIEFDRSLKEYPELGFDGWRNKAGEPDGDKAVQTQLGSFDGHRNHAGESEQENAVQTQLGSIDGYRNRAGESENDNAVQSQLG